MAEQAVPMTMMVECLSHPWPVYSAAMDFFCHFRMF